MIGEYSPVYDTLNITFEKEGEMKKTSDYQLVDYGIEHEQYFSGHGTGLRYTHSTLGVGDNYAEAVEDALEQAASIGWEIESNEEDSAANDSPSASERHRQYCEAEDHSDCDSGLYYYVGLRWNEERP